MKKGAKFLLVLILAGVILTLAGFKEAKLFFKDKTVNINEAKVSDLDEEAFIEGKINFAVGPFATLETSEKRFGVKTNVRNTDFYLVANFDADTYKKLYEDGEEFDMFYAVLSVSEGSDANKFKMLANRWEQYMEDYTRLMETGSATESGPAAIPIPPNMEVDIKGFLAKQPTDSEYIQYRDDAIRATGADSYGVSSLRIIDREADKNTAYILFFGGIGLIALGIILVVVALISSLKNKKSGTTDFY